MTDDVSSKPGLSRAKRIVFSCVLLVFAILVCEVFSVAVYALTKHKTFSRKGFDAARQTLLTKDNQGRDVSDTGQKAAVAGVINWSGMVQVLHPYLGYVCEPSETRGISGFGFYGEESIPMQRSSNTVIVGIFGGSVAFDLSFMSRETLTRDIQNLPAYRGRTVIVQTFALGGYKQPQQVLALAWLLSLGAEFDVVVNIDGFNEVALPPVENAPQGVFPSYPRGWVSRVHTLYNARTLGLLSETFVLRDKQVAWARLFDRAPLRYSATCNLIWASRNNRLARDRYDLEMQLKKATASDTGKLTFLETGPPFSRDSDALYRSCVTSWSMGSSEMRAMCESARIAYIHVLQPNQYLPNSKPMGDEEKKVAFQEDQPYRTGVEKAYPHLIEAGKRLKQQGENYLDLTGLFASHPEPLYRDSCCHMNQAGNDMIARTIVDALAQAPAVPSVR